MRLIDIFEASPWLRVTPMMLDQARGNKSQCIVTIPIEEFLALTTSNDAQIDDIKQSAKSITDYNKWAKMGDRRDYHDAVNARRRAEWEKEKEEYTDVGDFEVEYGSIIMPFLRIQLKDDGTGKVTGHEGRHRAASSLRVGNKLVQVALMMRPYEGMFGDSFSSVYQITSEHIPDRIVGQFRDVVVSPKNWRVIKDNLQGR